MNDTSNWLVHDHLKYDAILDECEMAADARESEECESLFQNFVKQLKLHMQIEDQVPYPLFIEDNGEPEGRYLHT